MACAVIDDVCVVALFLHPGINRKRMPEVFVVVRDEKEQAMGS